MNRGPSDLFQNKGVVQPETKPNLIKEATNLSAFANEEKFDRDEELSQQPEFYAVCNLLVEDESHIHTIPKVTLMINAETRRQGDGERMV